VHETPGKEFSHPEIQYSVVLTNALTTIELQESDPNFSKTFTNAGR
jgi:hypothetical protein